MAVHTPYSTAHTSSRSVISKEDNMCRNIWIPLCIVLVFLTEALSATQEQIAPQPEDQSQIKMKASHDVDWTGNMAPLVRNLPAVALMLAGFKGPPIDGKLSDTWTNPIDGADMVYVPAGGFTMGSSKNRDSLFQHDVYLDGYWMYKTEVTVAQYRKYCEAVELEMPIAPQWGWKGDHPIVNVSWDDARGYCEWAGVSLPTEAQWEKAARGTDGRTYPWGNEFDASKCVCSPDNMRKSTAPVGSCPSGASPYGCLDMAGNVWEWCADWQNDDYYVNAIPVNPPGPETGTYRVLRGGGWYFSSENYFRCALRSMQVRSRRYMNIGFRCAKTP